MTEDVFATHFPNFPVLPGVLVTETMSQVGAMAIASGYAMERKARLVALRGAKFRHFVRPGDQLLVEVDHLRSSGDREFWKAKARVGTKLIAAVAEFEYLLEPVPPAELERERELFAWAAGSGISVMASAEQVRVGGMPTPNGPAGRVGSKDLVGD